LVLGISIAAFLSVSSWANGECQRPHASSEANVGGEKPPSSLASPPKTPIGDSLKRIAEAQEAIAAASKPSDEKERDQRDLEAQQEMACWARWMFYATAFGALVAVVGTGLLLATLRHARSSAETQLRAYVNVFDVRAKWLAEPDDVIMKNVQVQVHFKNTGQTPAYAVTCWMRFDSKPRDAMVFDLETPHISATGVQGPGAINHLEEMKQVDCATGVVAAWKAGTQSLFVYGTINYSDAFDSGEVIGHDGTKYRTGKFEAHKGGYST
jgi:hypothetical protein